MRYLIHETQLHEIRARCDYLYYIFKLYFLPGKPEGKYTPLYPIGEKGPDILFITGHTPDIHIYLQKYFTSIPEKEIVITSCMGASFKRYAAKKAIYVPNINHKFCDCRNGEAYGFEFKISDAELNFCNAEGNLSRKIETAYRRLQ